MTMRLYHDHCHTLLVYKAQIVLDVFCNFTFVDNTLAVNKFQVVKHKEIPRSVNVDRKTDFYCTRCNRDVRLDNVFFRCDHCEKFLPIEKAKRIGMTINICETCIGISPTYKEFETILPKYDINKLKINLEQTTADVVDRINNEMGGVELEEGEAPRVIGRNRPWNFIVNNDGAVPPGPPPRRNRV